MNRRIEEELFPFYALGALTDEEKAEVEAYIAADSDAKARLAALQETAALLPNAVEPVAPSPNVKANLMARVQADPRGASALATPVPKMDRQRPSPPPLSWWDKFRQSFALPALAGTAVLAAILLFIWANSLTRQLDDLQAQVADLSSDTTVLADQLETLQTDNDELRIRNELLQQELQAQNDILASYQTPGTNTLAIGDNSGENPDARATLTVSSETGTATFMADNLQPLTADQVYQLWIIRGDQTLSAGIFEVDENGRVVLDIDLSLAATYDAVGVSIEPAGGSEQPTPDQIILLGVASS
ncbi:anti-sigma factor [Candidatus Leptofilum sp.]|uniref:anti-sigma factor n=1 Tax=Candidatus Leptofilum sp. TaxID=3241576 RepID=UPI003B5BADDC